MKQNVINHKRITAIVKLEADRVIYNERKYREAEKQNPGSEIAEALKQFTIPEVDIIRKEGVTREYITVNRQFLALVGYDDNLGGFLADYFGTDYKPEEGEPLRFRYLDGYLVNPTKVK